jgi:predicted nuclease of predicted toxin-antitoxin system
MWADVGLLHATDEAIWRYAEEKGAVLVTKDEDFSSRHRRGQRTVRVVWLRIGNVSRATVLKRFLPILPRLAALLESGEILIEIR